MITERVASGNRRVEGWDEGENSWVYRGEVGDATIYSQS